MKASFGPTECLAEFEAGAAWGGSTSPGVILKAAQDSGCSLSQNFVVVGLCTSGEDGPRTAVEKVGLYQSLEEVA